MECYHLLSGPGLLHVLWADGVSPSQQEERLLPPVSRPGSNLRLSGDVHRCGHTRAPKVTQGLPQRVSLSSPTQGPQIWSRQLITTCQTQSYTYIKHKTEHMSPIFTIWIITNHLWTPNCWSAEQNWIWRSKTNYEILGCCDNLEFLAYCDTELFELVNVA